MKVLAKSLDDCAHGITREQIQELPAKHCGDRMGRDSWRLCEKLIDQKYRLLTTSIPELRRAILGGGDQVCDIELGSTPQQDVDCGRIGASAVENLGMTHILQMPPEPFECRAGGHGGNPAFRRGGPGFRAYGRQRHEPPLTPYRAPRIMARSTRERNVRGKRFTLKVLVCQRAAAEFFTPSSAGLERARRGDHP